MEGEFDYLFKILVIGDSSVGKTSVLLRYVNESFNPEFQTTIGVDFRVNTVEMKGKKIKLQLWDTAGQDRFRNIVSSYYRGAQGIIMMFDMTQPSTFENIQKWHQETQSYLSSSVPRLLVGNKLDLAVNRKVSKETAEDLASSMSIPYIETSAMSSENVKDAFDQMTASILDRTQKGEIQAKENNSTRIDDRRVINSWRCCAN